MRTSGNQKYKTSETAAKGTAGRPFLPNSHPAGAWITWSRDDTQCGEVIAQGNWAASPGLGRLARNVPVVRPSMDVVPHASHQFQA